MSDMLIATLGSIAQGDAPGVGDTVRIAAAVLLGGVIGLERELRDKPAGFRTIVLISVGACIFTILSGSVGGPDWNSTRIAAQIVTGIGFLGAGAILRDRTNIVGLTTAATIWAVAAIGMAAGFGHLGLATLGTAAIMIVLLAFDLVEKWIGKRRDIQSYQILAGNEAATPGQVKELFERAGLRIRKQTYYEEGTSLVFNVWAMGAKSDHDEVRMLLVSSDEYVLRRS